jgi:hypothetical protein
MHTHPNPNPIAHPDTRLRASKPEAMRLTAFQGAVTDMTAFDNSVVVAGMVARDTFEAALIKVCVCVCVCVALGG